LFIVILGQILLLKSAKHLDSVFNSVLKQQIVDEGKIMIRLKGIHFAKISDIRSVLLLKILIENLIFFTGYKMNSRVDVRVILTEFLLINLE